MPMNEIAEGRKPFFEGLREDYKALSTKQVIAIIAAIALALILEVMGISGTCCVGFLIVAVVLYMIPHFMKVMSVRVKAMTGVVFIIVAMLVGTFAYTGVSQDYQSLIEDDQNTIRNLDMVYDEGTGKYTLNFEVQPTGLETGDSWVVKLSYGDITRISFGLIGYNGLSTMEIGSSDLEQLSDGWYKGSAVLDGMSKGVFEYLTLIIQKVSDSGNKNLSGYAFTYDSGISTGNEIKLCAVGAGISVGLVALIYYIILVFSHLMRSGAEKSRSKMEAEGRLYPKGYGLCKSCGATVLPGEVVCRKCGAYIEVPEELKPKKADIIVCSECGAEVPSDAEVCPKCGTRFDEEEETEVEHPDGSVDTTTDTVPCPHCGEQIPSNADWCPKCGKKVKE